MPEHKSLAAALAAAQGEDNPEAEAPLIRELARRSPRPRGGTAEQRFFHKVAFGISECWYWTGSLNRLGYGCIAKTLGETKAHRLSYRLFHGEIPEGAVVMHSCDVRCCVNPDHLSVGTQLDNVRDAVRKGRAKFPAPGRGEQNSMARLTRTQVEAMREAVAAGESQISQAKRFGVSAMTVSRAVRGESWR